MCGIAGVFGRPDATTVSSMLGTLVHRGPDDGFLVSGERFTLGARRLSIVDLERGRQPLANESRAIWAMQNGELYNAPELAQRLRAAGHQLLTHCDTEVLPHAYEQYGTDLFRHVDGMFAAAVWDDSRGVGLLARDRTGKKPLYYTRAGDALYFASELKGLLCVPGLERRLNLEALHHYLSLKHVPHPLSIFQGVSILPPAHALVYRSGQEPVVQRYWDLSFAAGDSAAGCDTPDEERALADQLLDLLRAGVKRRLMADVPIGFFLSGGIDSSLSTALAAELAGTRIKTFCLTYGDASSTEGKELDRKWARWVARTYDTEHHEETIEFTAFPENLRRVLQCFDEPFAGVISTYFLSQLISRHVKVALSGDGADELFGSYLSHRLATPLSRYPQYVRTGDARLLGSFAGQPDFLAQLYEPEDWNWRAKLLVFDEAEKSALYTPEVAAAAQAYGTDEWLRDQFGRLTARDPLNRILEAEFRTIFPDQVLTFVDRLSMAHSLEVRTAYLDTQVVEFVAALPGRLKIKDGETKYLLKQAALRYFPEEMVRRPKEGFLMPVTQWLLYNLQDYVRDTLSPDRLRRQGIFDAARVQALVDGMYDGQQPRDYTYVNKVLSLVVFQEWHDLYLAGGRTS